MVHDYHEALPAFDADFILQDGCAECEQRGNELHFEQLDGRNFERMWERAAAWDQGELRNISQAEIPMLRVLCSIQRQFENRGIAIEKCPGRSYEEQLETFEALMSVGAL